MCISDLTLRVSRQQLRTAVEARVVVTRFRVPSDPGLAGLLAGLSELRLLVQYADACCVYASGHAYAEGPRATIGASDIVY